MQLGHRLAVGGCVWLWVLARSSKSSKIEAKVAQSSTKLQEARGMGSCTPHNHPLQLKEVLWRRERATEAQVNRRRVRFAVGNGEK